jgi:uncharacterized protein
VTILDELLESVHDDFPVRSVVVGAHLTAVCSRRCGLASTVTGSDLHRRETIRDVGRLHLKSARELAEYARSANPLEASIGVAALNSLLQVDERTALEMNAFDVLTKQGAGKKVALVGHFPFVPALRLKVETLWVIELRPAEGDHPATAAPELIPQADVVALTGSALINHSLDALLSLARRDACVVMLGPSSPPSPLLFAHGVDVLAVAEVTDEALALAAISQGASFREVSGVRLLTLARPGLTL